MIWFIKNISTYWVSYIAINVGVTTIKSVWKLVNKRAEEMKYFDKSIGKIIQKVATSNGQTVGKDLSHYVFTTNNTNSNLKDNGSID